MRRKVSLISILFGFVNTLMISSVWSQNDNKPLRIYLDSEKGTWVQFSTYAQLWSRITENNPGSSVNDSPESVTSDISIRRFRFAVSAKPWENTLLFFQLGANNLNYLSPRGTSVDILDAYVLHDFSDAIGIGMGKSAWNGLSRFTAPSSSKLMTGDINFLALPTLDNTDDLIRKLSLFVKGKFAQLDYRMAVIKPLSVQNSKSFVPAPINDRAVFTDNRQHLQFSGYFKYEFLDSESNSSPFHVGTYLGSKRIFNLGVGFTYQNDALWSLDNEKQVYHDMRLFSADAFLETPLTDKNMSAITSYLGYFNFSFGPNYIRNLGANNPVNGVVLESSSFNGAGNAFTLSGTGEAVVGQLGYLFPGMGSSTKLSQLQPYVAGQYSKFDRLAESIFQYDIGINWFLNGHSSKFTLNGQNRPILYDLGKGLKTQDRKWMFVLQYQFRLD